MSNLFYLGEQDFFLSQGTSGMVVSCNQRGICFVMFHADTGVCPHCDNAKPEFQQLSRIIPGARFGLCNMSRCPNLMAQSLRTQTPLNRVPVFLLFINGRPWLTYAGEKQVKHFANFMQQAMQRIQNQQSFGVSTNSDGQFNVEDVTAEGMPYDYDLVTVTNSSVIGQMTCTDDGVCYLTSKESGLGDGVTPEQNPQCSLPSAVPMNQPSGVPQAPQAYRGQEGYRPQAQPYYPPNASAQVPQAQPHVPVGQPQRFAPQHAQQAYYPPQQPQQPYYPPQHAPAAQAYRQPAPPNAYPQPQYNAGYPPMNYPQHTPAAQGYGYPQQQPQQPYYPRQR